MRPILFIVAWILLASPAAAIEVEGRAGIGLGAVAVSGYATPQNTPRGATVLDPSTGRPREIGQTWFTSSPSILGSVLFQPWDGIKGLRIGFALADAAYPIFSRDFGRWGLLNATSLSGMLRLGPVEFAFGGALDEILVRACNPNGCRREAVFGPGADLRVSAAASERWAVGAHLHALWFDSWTTGPTQSYTAVLRAEYRLGDL